MKLLIGIKSCRWHMNRGDHNAIRNTWGQDTQGLADLRFFVGNGEGDLLPDEIHVDCPDDYDSLTLKSIEIVKWALEHGYDYAFLCDTDTFLVPRRLMTSGFEKYDFSGLTRTTRQLGKTFHYVARTRGGVDYPIENCLPWASGGYGFFLSKKAMEAIVAAPKPTSVVMIWCEDLWVGQQMGPLYNERKITMSHLDDFENKTSWHYHRTQEHWDYTPELKWQEKMYEEHKNDC